MNNKAKHKWTFRARFRKHAFGWRSQPAIKRIKEAVSEIKKVARKEPVLAAEGVVLFLEKLVPAIEQIDSSSGSIGSAVNNAIEKLVPVLSSAPADDKVRDEWMERIWKAVEEDGYSYIHHTMEFWGELCVTKERASGWSDYTMGSVLLSWSPDPTKRGYFTGTPACLDSLLKAERYDELLSLLEQSPYKWWTFLQYGVKALVAMGKKSEAIAYAQTCKGINENPIFVSRACEEIMLSSGMADEAYDRYAIEANQKSTYLATFRSIAKKYSHKTPEEILDDLAESTPGNEGKWFAAAKSAGFYNKAIELANLSPCDPITLSRAARDMENENPNFAIEAGMTAIKWLCFGFGYDITDMDVWSAYHRTMSAAAKAGNQTETEDRIRKLVEKDESTGRFVRRVLAEDLELN